MTDDQIIASMSAGKPAAKPGAWSKPLDEPAQFATSSAQINYEITQTAVRGEKAAAVRSAGSAETTISKERVLEEVRRADLRPLWIGHYAWLWSSKKPDRQVAMQELKQDLVREDFIGVAARLDQYVCVYFVAKLLGWDEAQGLRLEAIKALRPLLVRNTESGEYSLRRVCDRPARALWSRMVRGRMTAAAVRSEVEKIRPKKSNPKIHGRAGAAAKLLKQLKTWRDRDQLLEAFRIIQERLAALAPADSAVA